MNTYKSKPGKFGTLYLFTISYQEQGGGYSGTVRLWAYDVEHAENRFLESDDAEGWRITGIAKTKEQSGPRVLCV